MTLSQFKIFPLLKNQLHPYPVVEVEEDEGEEQEIQEASNKNLLELLLLVLRHTQTCD